MDGDGVQDMERERLMAPGEEAREQDLVDSDDGPVSTSSMSGSHRRLAAVACMALAAALIVALAPALHRPSQGLRSAAWSGEGDLAKDFSFGFGKSLKRLEDKMKGLTGTCSSGSQCNGNPGATRRSCDTVGNCRELPVAYCCTDPKSHLRTEINDGEVTCTCDTTSKTLMSFKNRLKKLEQGPMNMLNKIRAATGQCLTGQAACVGQGPSQTFDNMLHCCPRGYSQISARKMGLTTMCSCK